MEHLGKTEKFPSEQKKEGLRRMGLAAYESSDFGLANEQVARIARDFLGEEAADSLELLDVEKREKLKSVFYNASLEVTGAFGKSFDEAGNYIPESEAAFWAACDTEGPVAKKNVKAAAEAAGITINPEKIKELINNVRVEDAVELSVLSLKASGVLGEEDGEVGGEVLKLCESQDYAREVFSKVVPKDDYYYPRISRTEKVNDESILKFGGGVAHTEEERKVIDLAIRLANATWLSAQRHCAKKDGKTDRVDPDKRGGVFNTPDYRHIQQFQEAKATGLTSAEAVMRVAFELCKDSWMLED